VPAADGCTADPAPAPLAAALFEPAEALTGALEPAAFVTALDAPLPLAGGVAPRPLDTTGMGDASLVPWAGFPVPVSALQLAVNVAAIDNQSGQGVADAFGEAFLASICGHIQRAVVQPLCDAEPQPRVICLGPAAHGTILGMADQV
jgi:hypothetical protein